MHSIFIHPIVIERKIRHNARLRVKFIEEVYEKIDNVDIFAAFSTACLFVECYRKQEI